MHQMVCRLGLPPMTPLGELTALPQTPNWFTGWAPGDREGRREWRGGEGRGGRKEWRGGEGRGGSPQMP